MDDLEPLPPPRRRHGLLRRRRRSPWMRYGWGLAVPLAVVLVLAGLALRPSQMDKGRQGHQVITAGGGGGAATVDGTAGPSLSVSAGGAPAVSVYEAEDTTHNTLGPGTEVREVPGTSGGKVASHIGRGTPAGDLTFNDVAAHAAGAYALTIYYLLADAVARRLALWVNGKGPTILNFPPLGGQPIARVGVLHVTVTLKAGTNAIRFSNATAKYGPDLDRVTVTLQ